MEIVGYEENERFPIIKEYSGRNKILKYILIPNQKQQFMGKKLKTNTKIFHATEHLPPPDPSDYLLSEFSREQFEKSLAAMLETITDNRIQLQQELALHPESPYKFHHHETPEKHLDDLLASKDYWLPNTSHQTFIETTHKEKQIDESTASSGSVDSSCTFMLPQSLNKMKELAFKRSTNNSHYNLNRTPLHCLQRTRKSFIETPTSEIKSIQTGSNNNILCDELLSNSILTPPGKHIVSSRIYTFQDLVDKMPDLYMKGKKYFKLGELSIEDILHKIYFERYSYLDLRAYVPLASKRIQNFELFLDILYMSIKEFALRARNYLLTRLLGVVIKEKKIIKGENGEAQIIHEFGGYKRFAKHAKRYIGLIKRMYEATKSLETIALEAEKVCWTYLKPLLTDGKRFCYLEFHRQIFVKYYFSEPLIKDFLESISTYFEERAFYIQNYPTATRQLKELKEFYQLWHCDGLPEEFDEEEYENIPENHEEYYAEPHVQANIIRDLHKEYNDETFVTAGVAEESEVGDKSSVKKKKKNKKSKKNKKKDQEIVPQEEQIVAEDHISDNSLGTSEFDEEIQDFERKLEEQRIPKKIRKKVKPNIDQDWIERLRLELQKKRAQIK